MPDWRSKSDMGVPHILGMSQRFPPKKSGSGIRSCFPQGGEGDCMLYSSTTSGMVDVYGLERGLELMMDVGFPAIDLNLGDNNEYLFREDWRETADRIKTLADRRGVVFNQAHAPFGGGYAHYTEVLVPQMPRVFAFAGRVGIRQVVVHPLQRGRYYGHEQELFDMNMEFYRSLAPYAREAGVRIAIENMWQNHPVNGHIVDDVCADPHELAAYYDTLDDPDCFTVCLDLGHVALCGREPEDAVRVLGHDRLGALHIHDVDYVNDLHNLPGMGGIRWDAVCRALADIRYRGEMTLEAARFLSHYDKDFRPTACRFMADCVAHLAATVERMMEV